MPFNGHYNPSILHILFASFMYLFTRNKKCYSLAALVPTPSPPSSSFLYGGVTNITPDMPDEQRLFYTLMTGYEKSVRPTKKSSEAVVVKLGITLTQIMDIVSNKKKESNVCYLIYMYIG
jgi:hypothetical protein